MEIKKGLAEPLNSIKENGKKGKDFLAFWDFCLDFFGREDCIYLPHSPIFPLSCSRERYRVRGVVHREGKCE